MAYTPSNFTGTSLEELQKFVQRELEAISKGMQETIALDLRPVYRAPDKPREGMIVYADGTSWNPGAGKCSYEYRGAAWFKL